MLKKLKSVFYDSYRNDNNRRLLIFKLLNIVLSAISILMTVINIGTSENVLAVITAVYSVLCLANYFLITFNQRIVSIFFCVETFALFTVFVLTGIPHGFSVLWTLVVPACSLSVFGKKYGSIFSLAAFLMIIFLFWLPVGALLLLHPEYYSSTFMLRFPFVYVCLYFISLYVEIIREGTHARLHESEENYHRLYRCDALTGIYNRYAFYEEIENELSKKPAERLDIIVFDIDNFKLINDEFGHNAGDEVLKTLVRIITSNICEHSTAVRWGGEEFLVMLRCIHDPYQISEKIRKEVEDTALYFQNRELKFTVSAGVSVSENVSKDQISDCINRADKAMYLSKINGKNRTTLMD